jgi:acyl carrier protein
VTNSELQEKIRNKIDALAKARGVRVPNVTDDVMLLEAGLLDSASVLELVVWLESLLDTEIDLDQLTLDNFGTITRMVEFLSDPNRAG